MPQAARKTLSAYARAKNDHDLDRIIELRHDECYDHPVPLGTEIRGKEALREFFTALFRSVPDYYGDFVGTAWGDDSAAVWGHWGGTLGEDFLGIPVEAGRRLEIPVAFVCEFRDGLLVADHHYFDLGTLAAQAGVSLEPLRVVGPDSPATAAAA
jgi:steroid delta-isomerase-like uncharacterized protein